MAMMQSEPVSKRWSDLSPRVRRLLIVGGTIEGILKIAALVDLARRPPSEVRGPRGRWAAAIVLVNSVGLLPIVYFVSGRQRTQHSAPRAARSRKH
jgi:hypothetical protein